MQLSYEPLALHLKTPVRIAHGTSEALRMIAAARGRPILPDDPGPGGTPRATASSQEDN